MLLVADRRQKQHTGRCGGKIQVSRPQELGVLRTALRASGAVYAGVSRSVSCGRYLVSLLQLGLRDLLCDR